MPKSPDAFRTISEVADWLDVQAHVLRFWESKFSQVKPIKRAGGRRYYRPNDMMLLGGIKKLLHEDGLTIKGVQKILREEGMGHVSDMSAPLDDQLIEGEDATVAPDTTIIEEETAVVLDFAPAEAEKAPAEDPVEAAEPEPTPEAPAADAAAPEPTPEAPATDAAAPVVEAEPVVEDASDLPDFVQQPLDADIEATETDNLPAAEDSTTAAEPLEAQPDEPVEDEQEITTEGPPEPEAETEAPAAEAPAPTPKPRIIDLPPLTPEAEIAAAPSTLTAAFRLPGLSAAQARDVEPLLEQLTALRDRMEGARQGRAPKG